jgi:hypothetical protein
MAAATKGKRSASKAKGRTSAKTKKSGSATKRAGSATKKAGSAGRKAAAELPDPVNRGANAAAAAAHAAKGTMAAGQAVGALAWLAKKPLIIGAAAVAGVAGGVALSKRAGR